MNRRLTKAFIGALSFAAALSTAVVFNASDAQAKKASVKKVTASAPSGKNVYVAKGKKVKITTTVKVKPNKKANKKVTYKSANKKIATVSAKGVVKGVKAGKTKITITSKKNKKKKTVLKVYVKKAAVKKVKINSKNFVLSAGGTKKLTAKVTPKKNVYKKVVWTSSNKKVATVTSKGVVKGLREGSAKITASAVDGSKKKASVTVTVGAGIASVSVVTSDLVRVTLTGTKALSATNFQMQTRSGVTSTKYVSVNVESVTTKDQKTYDVTLKQNIWKTDYLKVTIPALKTNKSVEIYVDHIAGYGDKGNSETEYVTYNKDSKDTYDDNFSITNTNCVGAITYTSLNGLPSGLKAYFSENRTSVKVRGKFNNIERGTTAVLSGYDEKGTTFTKKIIFVVGSDKEIAVAVKPTAKELTYRPDDPKTIVDEDSGADFSSPYTIYKNVYAAGGSDDYSYKVTYNGKSLYELCYDKDYNRVAINPGTYTFDVEVEDDSNESLKANAKVSYTVENGITVSGKVVDAAGQPVKYSPIRGYTKKDEYGNYNEIDAVTRIDGGYEARVLPGDYYTYVNLDYNRMYDYSAGNVFSSNAVKNFKVPVYRVNIAPNIAGAAGYRVNGLSLLDVYGNTYSVEYYSNRYDKDHSLYAYLPAGDYEVVTYDYSTSSNEISAYGKIEESTDGYQNKTYDLDEKLGTYKLSGSFSVNGNNTVVLNAVKKEDTQD